MLKFLVDHNVPRSVGLSLSRKYDIKFVGEINSEMSDTSLLQLARKEKRIVISNDKDFISLAQRYETVDMILFDLPTQDAKTRITALKNVLPKIETPFGLLIIR
jgi:predicted nuclease of predicted toxin-antitoxin system